MTILIPIAMRIIPPMILAIEYFPFKSLAICLPRKKPIIQIINVMPAIVKASHAICIFKVVRVIPTAQASMEVATP